MSLFGKILAFLNILGMAGLMALAMMDYSKHQEWLYANYLRDLLINGLPVHKEENELNQKGRLTYENVSQQTLKELFPSNPVTTQKEEVERVKKALDLKLNAEADKGKQTALYATYLLPLAQTNGQRERLLAIRLNPTDDKNAELKDEFERAFKEVLEGQFYFVADKGAVTTKKMSDAERKDAISDLLFAMVEAEGADKPDLQNKKNQLFQLSEYKRYFNVVGLAAANGSLNRQSKTQNRILADVSLQRARARDTFVAELLPLLDHSKDIARNVETLKLSVAQETALVETQKVLVNLNQTAVTAAEEELNVYRKDTATKLARLRQMSAAVFDLRVELRDKTVSNQDNERTIRELEGWRWVPFVGGKFLIKSEEP